MTKTILDFDEHKNSITSIISMLVVAIVPFIIINGVNKVEFKGREQEIQLKRQALILAVCTVVLALAGLINGITVRNIAYGALLTIVISMIINVKHIFEHKSIKLLVVIFVGLLIISLSLEANIIEEFRFLSDSEEIKGIAISNNSGSIDSHEKMLANLLDTKDIVINPSNKNNTTTLSIDLSDDSLPNIKELIQKLENN